MKSTEWIYYLSSYRTIFFNVFSKYFSSAAIKMNLYSFFFLPIMLFLLLLFILLQFLSIAALLTIRDSARPEKIERDGADGTERWRERREKDDRQNLRLRHL